ncbi:hypothetical protein [Oscillatoria acuminata]|nr:hypothetical protein [Oscillatoria acuminata]
MSSNLRNRDRHWGYPSLAGFRIEDRASVPMGCGLWETGVGR